ncbi:MAG TPA: M48 family metalloprotease [Rhodothermales bacterium]|nr:M48 family metalloprotease [Rhodothermales bacterium]
MKNNPRLLIGLVMAIFALISYYGSSSYNPVTGEKQHVSITPDQEIALGLQAKPSLVQEYGGIHPDSRLRQLVEHVGKRLLERSEAGKTDWNFEFTLLADPQTINAFALPGGQVFITYALLSRLQTEGQLAGVLGHEIAHVIARHGAQQMAKEDLTGGLLGAVSVASGSAGADQIAQQVAMMVNMKYGRNDELESDKLGVRFMADAGYNPNSMASVMEILKAAAGPNRQPEFASTHPDPDNRVFQIQEEIRKKFPNGVPANLQP